MGRERAGYRQHIFIYIACAIAFYVLFQSCGRVPVRIMRVMEGYNFKKADALMDEGKYAAALAENRRILAEGPASLGDQAIYRIGLIYTHNENNSTNIYIARDYFNEILQKYPESPLRSRAKLWINIINRIDHDQKEIVKLKEANNNLDEANNVLDNRIEKKEKEIILLKNKVSELENQIESLKKIDIGIEQKKSKGVP